jgi:hypothetical protein
MSAIPTSVAVFASRTKAVAQLGFPQLASGDLRASGPAAAQTRLVMRADDRTRLTPVGMSARFRRTISGDDGTLGATSRLVAVIVACL